MGNYGVQLYGTHSRNLQATISNKHRRTAKCFSISPAWKVRAAELDLLTFVAELATPVIHRCCFFVGGFTLLIRIIAIDELYCFNC